MSYIHNHAVGYPGLVKGCGGCNMLAQDQLGMTPGGAAETQSLPKIGDTVKAQVALGQIWPDGDTRYKLAESGMVKAAAKYDAELASLLAQHYLAKVGAKMMDAVDKFQQEVLDLPCAPEPLTPHRFAFRHDHLHEELSEFKDAYREGHYEPQVDALVDLIYVAMGALLEMGVLPEEAFAPVHIANMQKVRGETKRGESYDAIKPDGWKVPDHGAMIKKLRLRAAVRPALLEATEIMLERGAEYNKGSVKRDDHFPLGVTSAFDAMWLKMIRLRSDIEAGIKPNRDHPRDLINYAGFMLDLIDGRPLQ